MAFTCSTLFYYFAIVNGNKSKQLFCILLSGNFENVLQTLAMLAERISPTPGYYYATATFVLLLAQSAYFSWFYYTVKKFKQLFRSTKYNKIITYSNYILAFNFVALVLIRNFSEPRTWNLFFALLSVHHAALLLCLHDDGSAEGKK